jgi:hypothetical protein
LGTVNGISQTSAAFVRAVGPAVAGVMWSWSLTNTAFPFDYHFVFVIVCIIFFLGLLQGHYFLPKSLNKRVGMGADDGGAVEVTAVGH